ncbi:dehydrogenase [Aristophania vespae]|uniref:Dehydrogenase n=1 Tax=Aristophania vespae TaxID=2697033 RepID=A0A6P1NBX7_9PROT|nr:GMC family oxidoreductase [Aristophania vespae]QHI96185.1 dehydrogenase [Aristophania vespae]
MSSFSSGGIKPDIVVIGSGVGGGGVAYQLASTGARVLILERGDFLPKEAQNRDAEAVFVQNRYRTKEEWQHDNGKRFRPGHYHFVGGHTKFYGTAMFRFRESDFEEARFEDGISPAWPISYRDLEPYYAQAEELFGVRGQAGIDPTEPPRSGPYPHPAIPHEPVIARMAAGLAKQGLKPFHMPSAVDFGDGGKCERCGTCDAFPCFIGAKGDAETSLLNPILNLPNVALQTNTKVLRLITDKEGKKITSIEVDHNGKREFIEAPLFVLSAGAINSALILLRSRSEQNPNGVANRSGVVGRYLMNHHLTGLIGVLPFSLNETHFPKTISVNDYYYGLPGDPTARGNVQMLGKIQGAMIRSIHKRFPVPIANMIGKHTVDWLIMSEDLPNAESQVRFSKEGEIEIAYHPGGWSGHDRFVKAMRQKIRKLGFPMVMRHSFGIEAPSHQCGTVRMGNDPESSALNSFCQAHDHPNLYVVDGGFFPSSAGLNPALTIAAQALRVGAHLKEKWQQGLLDAQL